MTRDHIPKRTIFLARDLGPTAVGDVHAAMVQALCGPDNAPVEIVLEGEGAVSPLTLQLLVSASKAGTSGSLTLCDAARACLACTDRQVEN